MRSPTGLGLAGQRVLVIDADLAHATTTVEILRARGADAEWVADVSAGLRALATREPQVMLLALALASPGPAGAGTTGGPPTAADGGLWLLRRLRDDYMGRRPRVIVTEKADRVDARLADFGVDAVMLKPANADILMAAVAPAAAIEPLRELVWSRELIKCSVLEGDTQFALTTLAKRLQLAAGVTDCIVTATVGDRDYAASAGGVAHEEFDSPVWESARVSLDAGATVLAQDFQVTSSLAVAIEQPGGTRLGVLVLHDESARTFSPEMREALVLLAVRLYSELAWRSVQERITADNARLYEISMLDPMLPGVWTRAALDQALAAEVAARQRSGDPVTVAILDLRRLKAINDRHGHAAGDAAMRHVATIVRQQLRPHDLLARYSGDALAVVLVGASLVDARRVVERLREAVAGQPMTLEGHALALEIVGGLACSLSDEDTADVTLTRAAQAVKAAKRRPEGIVLADAQVSAHEEPGAAHRGLEAGAILGGMYKIIHEIDRGAMGVVYRAEDLGLGRAVALKTLRPDLARDVSFVQRFRGEATTLAALRHENLVQVFSFGSDGDDVYFVMELVEGEPLEERLTRAETTGPAIPLSEVVRVLEQIAGALDTMHAAGILHRDVKPANIVLDRLKNRAVLVDVGIAKRRGGPTDAAGTPGFIAPESFQGGTEGPTADVYGLAATAYMVLAMVPPFGDGDITQILSRQQAKASLPPSAHRPGLPHAVNRVLLQSLDPDAARRHPSAGALVSALAKALETAAPEVERGEDFQPKRRPEVAEAHSTAQLRGSSAVVRGRTGAAAARAAVEAATGGNNGARSSSIDERAPGGSLVLGRDLIRQAPSGGPERSATLHGQAVRAAASAAANAASAAANAASAPDLDHPDFGSGISGELRISPPSLPGVSSSNSGVVQLQSAGSMPPGLGPPSNQAMRAALRHTPGRPMATVPPGMGIAAPAQTRGVLFRSAPGLLGARLGASWLRELSRANAGLAEVLQPQASLLAWYPTDLFLTLLHSVPAESRDPRQFARELGRASAATTFARFLGADPNRLNAQTLLDMIGVLWHRYHTWGRLEVVERGPAAAQLVLSEAMSDPLLTSSVAGLVEKMAGLAGLMGAAIEVVADDVEDGTEALLLLKWREGTG